MQVLPLYLITPNCTALQVLPLYLITPNCTALQVLPLYLITPNCTALTSGGGVDSLLLSQISCGLRLALQGIPLVCAEMQPLW